MKYLIRKNNNFRYKFYKNEKRRLISKIILKNILNNKNLINVFSANYLKNKSFLKKSIFNKNTRVRCINRCFITNRSRGVFKNFNLSRFVLRDLMLFGLIPGYSKSVW